MQNEDFLNKKYDNFRDFLSTVISRELEFFILDSKFTSAFNYRIKELFDQIENNGKNDVELSVLFNTEGDIAVIDAQILGQFLSDSYYVKIQEYYKNMPLNKIINRAVNGNEKIQTDFLTISYKILLNQLNELYKDIRYKKEVLNRYISYYKLEQYVEKDLPLHIISLIILEDVSKYMKIKQSFLKKSVDIIIFSKK